MSPAIRVGCCGFPKARPIYFAHFNLVEVQQTFYKLPAIATARRWREEAPPGFTFTLKAWQLVTHEPSSPTYRKAGLTIPEAERERYGAFRPTNQVFDAWARTLEIAQALEARAVVFQCPARFTPTDEHVADLRAFFSQVERGGLVFVWEPRGDWPDELVGKLCQELNLIHGVDPFQRLPVHGVPAYFRLHGRTGYRYRYTDDDLRQLRAWCEPYPEVYCLFNNVSMWEDALRFALGKPDDPSSGSAGKGRW